MRHALIVILLATSLSAQDLPRFKAKVMAADYRGDLTELAALRDELAKFPNDPLARYWSGFASWRIAINGANHGMKPEELTTNLHKAASDFYASLRLKDDFADAYAAAASVNGWLAVYVQSDAAALGERVALAQALLARAMALDATNPRALWVKGSFFLYRGDSATAIGIYQQMLKEAERRGVDAKSPLPDWGKPEALMSLAYAHSQQKPPDLAAAKREATAALEAAPEWSYVRDNLLPSIEKQMQ